MSTQSKGDPPPGPPGNGKAQEPSPRPLDVDDTRPTQRHSSITDEQLTTTSKIRRFLIGAPRSVEDPGVFHTLSLVAFLAWVGLGADGLSSSSYGPSEAFRTLLSDQRYPGNHTYLLVLLALATALTVFVISYAYSRIIEHFPFGGGGYVVATRLLGRNAGVVSGSALLVDYVLTITTSVAAGAEAVFDFLPEHWLGARLPVEFIVILVLVLMNLRGVKESVKVLTPIFLTFLGTHVVLIVGALASRATELPAVFREVHGGFSSDLAAPSVGLVGIFALLLRAYSMGAGTYTGIEAVSNGLQIMREPKVETGKRTMALMAVSLALTAGGITLGYLLMHVQPVAGKTMNYLFADGFAGRFAPGGIPIGSWFVIITLASEALLLFVAAQTGFIDGPRVMANMASDSWLPHRFAQLSDRLTMQNGVFLMGFTSVAALAYTRGDVTKLVTMYSINVFVTFSLSQMAMCRFWYRGRDKHPDWKKHISVHVIGLAMCLAILTVTVYEKFGQGGWVTLVVTGLLIAVCFLIRMHYRSVQMSLKRLDQELPTVPQGHTAEPKKIEPRQPTAVLLVGSYAGLGIHSLLTIQRLFPNYYKNFIFVSIGVIDSATFKDIAEVEEVRERTESSLKKYVELAHSFGLAADYRYAMGTEAVAEAVALCVEVGKEYPRTMVFAGKLIFERERWFQRFLHNE
ncbi:MAG TPA: APC family permease, partial [Myxococcaceae bacterium]|nr:APC family permease [Myxococcaceae bacterium]